MPHMQFYIVNVSCQHVYTVRWHQSSKPNNLHITGLKSKHFFTGVTHKSPILQRNKHILTH